MEYDWTHREYLDAKILDRIAAGRGEDDGTGIYIIDDSRDCLPDDWTRIEYHVDADRAADALGRRCHPRVLALMEADEAGLLRAIGSRWRRLCPTREAYLQLLEESVL